MSDAKVFELSFAGEFPKSKSMKVEMHWGLWVGVAVVLLFLVVGVPILAAQERMQSTGGYLALQAQCLDSPGHEKCGSEAMRARRQHFLSSRLDGPDNVPGGGRELSDYYSGAIAQGGDDSDPSADQAPATVGAAPAQEQFRRRRELLSAGSNKHSEAALERVARGAA